MKNLREKKMLARLARNAGTPDLALESSIILEEELDKKLFEPKNIPSPKPLDVVGVESGGVGKIDIISELKPTSLIQQATESITKTANLGPPNIGTIPIALNLQKLEFDGMRKSIKDIANRVNTLAFGGGGTGIVRMKAADDVVNTTLANNTVIKFQDGVFIGSREVPAGNVIIANTSGNGIKVDLDDPTFGWRDIIGSVIPKAAGAGSPTRRVYFGGANIYGDYSFVVNDLVDFIFHIPHDYVPGSNLYFHVHWSHTGTSISGNAVFTMAHTYSKGHNQENFSAEKIFTIDVPTPDVATIPQYRHRIDEVPLTIPGGNTTLTDSNRIEPDGLLGVTLKLTGIPTIGGLGGGQDYLFIHTCDLHYQSTNMATKGKAPNFYTGI